jgi:hypothetical protein
MAARCQPPYYDGMIDASKMKVVQLRPADASGRVAEAVWLGSVTVDPAALLKPKSKRPPTSG